MDRQPYLHLPDNRFILPLYAPSIVYQSVQGCISVGRFRYHHLPFFTINKLSIHF